MRGSSRRSTTVKSIRDKRAATPRHARSRRSCRSSVTEGARDPSYAGAHLPIPLLLRISSIRASDLSLLIAKFSPFTSLLFRPARYSIQAQYPNRPSASVVDKTPMGLALILCAIPLEPAIPFTKKTLKTNVFSHIC